MSSAWSRQEVKNNKLVSVTLIYFVRVEVKVWLTTGNVLTFTVITPISATWAAVVKGGLMNHMLWIKTESNVASAYMKISTWRNPLNLISSKKLHTCTCLETSKCVLRKWDVKIRYRKTPTIICNLWQLKLSHLIYLEVRQPESADSQQNSQEVVTSSHFTIVTKELINCICYQSRTADLKWVTQADCRCDHHWGGWPQTVHQHEDIT